ncbi:hypothetical protein EVA_16758 [gut metagenome]|uniref:Uncharacterized protein n=1 Tax=gut metagenome TaxID=749906 RepID=J9G6M1_9ZZZZ
MLANSSSLLTKRLLRPGTWLELEITSNSVIEFSAAKFSNLAKVASPMPRRGTLIIRSRLKPSLGLKITRR